MREGDARGHGRDFQGSPLGTAVPPVTLDVRGRDLAPRQPGELSMPVWLVALVAAAAGARGDRGPLTANGIYQMIASRGRQCGVDVFPACST